jgi:hypothetical protein
MNDKEFFHLVQKHFGYLVSDQGFEVVQRETFRHFDNAQVVFQSENCRIRVLVDRGEVYVDAAPLPPVEHCWIDLGTLIAFLKNDDLDNSYDIEIPHQGDRIARLEAQIQQLAALLLDHCSQICSLFSREASDRLCTRLKEFGLRRLEKQARLRWPNSVDF